MIAAEKAGLTPQEPSWRGSPRAGARYLDGFHISFDNWHSTDGPENHELARTIYRALRATGLIATKHHRAVLRPGQEDVPARPLHQGRMPEVRREGPVRRQLRQVCGAVYCAHRPEEPVLGTLTGATPVLKQSEHFFFKLSDPRCIEFLQAVDAGRVKLQPEVLNKIKRMVLRPTPTRAT